MSFRHTANILRPADTKGSRGGPEGEPTLLVEGWPCEVTQIGSTEVEQAGGSFADKTFEAIGRDPGVPITPRDFLQWQGRELEITSIIEPVRVGAQMVLTCGGAA